MTVPIVWYLILSAALFCIGICGFLIKRNIITIFMSIELMLNAGEEERTHGSRAAYLAGIPGVLALFTVLASTFLTLRISFGGTRLGSFLVTTGDLSRVLFRNLLLPFEVTSVLILVAILGAVVLARKEH